MFLEPFQDADVGEAQGAAAFESDPMRGRGVGAACGAEGFSCAREIEQRSTIEERSRKREKIRMRVPHRGFSERRVRERT